MTSSSTRLLALAHSFAARGGAVDERADVTILRGRFATVDDQAEWVSLRDSDVTPFLGLQIYDPEVGGDLDLSEAFSPDRAFVITIRKPVVPGVAAFVFSAGASAHLAGSAPSWRVLCAQLEERAAFRARGLDVDKWNADQPLVAPEAPLVINARPFVRDFVPSREVAEDLSPWIISRGPAVSSQEYRVWSATAARRLVASLVSTIVQEEDAIWLQASGPPLVRFRADDAAIIIAATPLMHCAEWVFLSGKDIEVRHLLFAAELARAFRPDKAWPEILANALESARVTYEAHVQSSSRETLKALNDLRKSVIEEAQKVTQRSQDLTSGLWRDVAVSSAPFVLKVLGDATKAPGPAVTDGFYFAAAVFILISFLLQSKINSDFLENQRIARSRWFETLYAYVSTDERERIADGPIRTAEQNYQKTRTTVGLIYLALIVILVAFGGVTLANTLRWTPVSTSSSPAVRCVASCVEALDLQLRSSLATVRDTAAQSLTKCKCT